MSTVFIAGNSEPVEDASADELGVLCIDQAGQPRYIAASALQQYLAAGWRMVLIEQQGGDSGSGLAGVGATTTAPIVKARRTLQSGR
jgi:hypothetical protein